MATPHSPESVTRKPLPQGSPSRFKADGEQKENVRYGERKPLPEIPIPSGRIHGAPMSPVRVNVQPENWAPHASSAAIEGGKRTRLLSREEEQYRNEQFESADARQPATLDLPYRQSYAAQQGDIIQQPQAAFLPSLDSPSSRPPSNGSSTAKPGLRREYPEPIDEYGEGYAEQPVPRLHYHHQSHASDGAIHMNRRPGTQSPSMYQNDSVDMGQSINRHLTPNSIIGRNTPTQRPLSEYSDMGARSRSPGMNLPGSPNWGGRAPSANSGRSHDNRPMSYVDLQNMSYPQAPPPPISLDNSQLRSVVGTNASLLTMAKTLDMYRQNVKKLNDAETQYAFAIFLIQAAQEAGLGQEGDNVSRKASPKPGGRDLDSPYVDKAASSPQELLGEAKHILQKLSDRSYPFAQYYLADGYASGLFSKGKEDYATAFPLFVAASKHGHAESGYRAALCYEFGWGSRKDPAKAVQFYRQSASKNHPGAMTRLGRACLSGDLGLNKYREGLKWLKRATESADIQYNAAPYHLGLLYETGYGDDIFQDEIYAAQLFTQAADLGHPEACYRLGDAYEHGKLSCPRDPALSVHFYTGAAQRGHPAAMMALCAWYMVGAEPVLEKDENEAYEWARQAADCGKQLYILSYETFPANISRSHES